MNKIKLKGHVTNNHLMQLHNKGISVEIDDAGCVIAVCNNVSHAKTVNKINRTKPQRVYIAGPMTGFLNFNREAFNKKADELYKDGYIVLNPAFLPDGLKEPEYMDICMAMIRSANLIYMLPGWNNSLGARLERAYGEKVGIEIIHE